MAALSAVQHALEYSIVCDKGHKSKSKRQSTLEFWIVFAQTQLTRDREFGVRHGDLQRNGEMTGWQ